MEINLSEKKVWQTPDVLIISSRDIRAKHFGHNEGFFSKTVSDGFGGHKFYHSGMYQGNAPTKLSSLNS